MLKQHITQTASAQPAPVTNSPAFPPGTQQQPPLAGLPSPARGTRPEQREEWVEQLPWDELFPDPRRRDSRRKFLSLVSQHTNEDTGQAFLRVETIARKVGMTPRTAQRCRRDLEQARLLFVEDRGQLHRCSVFSINFGTFVTPNHDVGVPGPDKEISTPTTWYPERQTDSDPETASLAHRLRELRHFTPTLLVDTYGVRVISMALRELAELLENPDHGLINPAGWVTWRCKTLAAGEPPTLLEVPETLAPVPDAAFRPSPDSRDPPLVSDPPEPEAAAVWELTLEELEEQLPRPSFETWLRDTVGHRMDEDSLVVEVPSALGIAWLERRAYHSVQKTVEKVLDRPMEVNFAVRAGGPVEPGGELPEEMPPAPPRGAGGTLGSGPGPSLFLPQSHQWGTLDTLAEGGHRRGPASCIGLGKPRSCPGQSRGSGAVL